MRTARCLAAALPLLLGGFLQIAPPRSQSAGSPRAAAEVLRLGIVRSLWLQISAKARFRRSPADVKCSGRQAPGSPTAAMLHSMKGELLTTNRIGNRDRRADLWRIGIGVEDDRVEGRLVGPVRVVAAG